MGKIIYKNGVSQYSPIPDTPSSLYLTGMLIQGGTVTLSSNSATTIDSIALSSFTTAEYTLSLQQGTITRSSKVYVQNNGTFVDYVEYAVINTGGTIGDVVVESTISSTNSVLQVTVPDAAANNVKVKLSKVVI